MPHEDEYRRRLGELRQQLGAMPPVTAPAPVDETDDEESKRRFEEFVESLEPATRAAIRGERSPAADARAHTLAA